MPLRVLRSAAREFGDVLRAATTTHRRLRDELTVIATLAGALGSFLQKRGQEIDDKR